MSRASHWLGLGCVLLLAAVVVIGVGGCQPESKAPAPAADPAKPEDPAEPSEPETPPVPEEPSEPEEPAVPEEPSEPAEPPMPEEPSEPESPATPEEPSEPAEPATPEEPVEPPQPSEPAAAADPSPGAPVSSYAPADDLVGQVAYFVERVTEAVETEEEYADSQDKIAKDANTLILIALALGLHDQDNKHKAAAGTLMKAAQDLAGAGDYAAAKAAVEAVEAAAASEEASDVELKWEKVASLHELMEQVPTVNTNLKRYIRRFDSSADRIAGYSATIAVIGQGSMPNVAETEAPDKGDEWVEFSIQMRNAAGAVNAAVHALDKEAAGVAMDALQQSCDDCHAVFHQEEVETE